MAVGLFQLYERMRDKRPIKSRDALYGRRHSDRVLIPLAFYVIYAEVYNLQVTLSS